MKKIFYLLLAMLIVLSACSSKKLNEFRVNNVKELQEYKNTIEKYTRYNEKFTDKLVASEDYGELIPFVGRYLEAAIDDWKTQGYRYGLCTADGKIVVDPVFDGVYTITTSAGNYYLMNYAKSADEIRTADSEDSIYDTRSILLKSDGSRVINLPKNAYANSGSDKIIVIENGFEAYDSSSNMYVYDKDLKLQFYVMNITNYPVFSDGLANVAVGNGDMYYLNENGERAIEGNDFSEINEFAGGLACVRDKDSGLYGYIGTDGEYVIRPQFVSAISFSDDGYAVVSDEKNHFIIDKSGNNIGISHSSNLLLLEGGDVYYEFDEGWPAKYRSLDNDEFLKCPVCGENSAHTSIQATYGRENYKTMFLHEDCEEKTTLFSSKGELIAQLPQTFSGYVAAISNDTLFITAFETEGDNGQIVVYDRKTGDEIDRVEKYANFHSMIGDDKYILCDYSRDDPKYVVYTEGEGISEEVYDYLYVLPCKEGECVLYIKDGVCGAKDAEMKDIIRVRLNED